MKILRKLFRAFTKKFLKRKSVKRGKSSRRIARPIRKKFKVSRRKSLLHRRPVRKVKIKKKVKSRRRTKKLVISKKLSKVRKQKPSKPINQGEYVGEITHYFSKIKVCVIHVKQGVVSVGDKIEIRGHTTRFTQKILSLQIENSDVKVAHKGQMAGLKVDKKCRAGDQVFKIVA